MKWINIEEVLMFHKKIVDQTGGLNGIRDIGLIESALNRAYATFDGSYLYKEIEDRISATTYGLIKNHGFIDGNKRIGVAVMLLLLRMNGIEIRYTQNELVQLGLGVATGLLGEKSIRKWIKKHMVA